MKINELIKRAHNNAVEKGFYDCPICGTIGDDHHSAYCIDNYTDEQRRSNIGELLMLIVSELGEALEADRSGKFADWDSTVISGITNLPKSEQFPAAFERYIKDTFEDEIADTFIRLFDLCGYLKINIEKHILAKMAYNETRGYRHGKRY